MSGDSPGFMDMMVEQNEACRRTKETTLKAVAEWLDKPCLNGTEDAMYKCPRCVRQLRDVLHEGKMPGEEK